MSASNYDNDTESLVSAATHHVSRSKTPKPVQKSSRKGRTESFHSRRPAGPRAPSPLPPGSPSMNAMEIDIEGALESTLARMSPDRPSTPQDLSFSDEEFDAPRSSTPIHETPSRIPRSARRTLAGMDSSPKGKTGNVVAEAPSIVPLTIKKKALTGAGVQAPSQLDPIKSSPSARSNTDSDGRHETAYSARKRADSWVPTSDAESSGEPSLVQLRKRTREDVSAYCDCCCSSPDAINFFSWNHRIVL